MSLTYVDERSEDFHGHYGDHRNATEVRKILTKVTALLDELAAKQGINMAVIPCSHFKKNNEGFFYPCRLDKKDPKYKEYFEQHLTPLLTHREELCMEWLYKVDDYIMSA